MKYGIIGEDDSDVETLDVIIRRLSQTPNLSTMKKGYDSCGELLRKGANQLHSFATQGCTRLVVCYDSDGHNPAERYAEALNKIVSCCSGITPFETGVPLTGIPHCCCILIPVQEIEAWILADIEAVTNVFTGWHPDPVSGNPEEIASPKEYLERLSQARNKKPIYHHAVHNRAVAAYINLETVRKRCRSFEPLVNFVLN